MPADELPYIELSFHDEMLDVELPLLFPLAEPLSFVVDGEITHEQFEEIIEKVSYTEVEVTDAYLAVLDFLHSWMDNGIASSPEENERIGELLGTIAWFDAGVGIIVENWAGVARTAQDNWPFESEDSQQRRRDKEELNERLRQLFKQGDESRSIQVRLLKDITESSEKAAIVSKQYMSQKHACHILEISDKNLSPYCNDLTTNKEDPKGLNGILLGGKYWRFSRAEVYRFGNQYYKSMEKEQGEGDADVKIRGRDI